MFYVHEKRILEANLFKDNSCHLNERNFKNEDNASRWKQLSR